MPAIPQSALNTNKQTTGMPRPQYELDVTIAPHFYLPDALIAAIPFP